VSGLHLKRTAENADEIDALGAALEADGGGRVGMAAVVHDLPRKLRRTWAPTPRLLGRKVTRAYTWEAADRRDPVWWPQGITNSAHTGLADSLGHDVLATSWYAKDDAGSRISVVDLERKRYGHVLLVTPTVERGEVGMKPLKVHAGGIVWHGPFLHVAGTGRGFFSCRTEDVMRVPAGSPYETYGHRYVLPVRFAYRQEVAGEGASKLRFSFFTVDRGTDPPSIVVGEYGSASRSRRFGRFPIQAGSWLPIEDEEGYVRPDLDDRGLVRMQGISLIDGTYYITASNGPFGFGTVHVGQPGSFKAHRWATPMGPEDLLWWPETGALWSVSEHPRRRWVFAMDQKGFC
jgi:hypothetical protein